MAADFLSLLESRLPTSTAADRKEWAQKIVDQDISLQDLFPLLSAKYTTRSRFIWLLSDIGEADPTRIKTALPELLALSQKIQYTPLDQAFARLWMIAGVPAEQEGIAIDRMFELLNTFTVNVSIKYNALRVLETLMESYPELKTEFTLALEDQVGKYTSNFDDVLRKKINEYNPVK